MSSVSRARRLVAAASLATAAATACAAAAAAGTRTITTTYQYNADGAPSALTVQVDAAPPTTSYLTWDNFTPDAAAPARGTVHAADGNLLGVGPRPGAPAGFAYDVRDRLTACGSGGQPATTYAYHPASLMKSSTLASGDALQFYYDNGAAPRMVNTMQPSTGAAASFLGPVRYVSDGSQQVLFTPRKDVAGVYDAAAQSLAPYTYEPYGASERAGRPRSPGYDLTANPFQYAGEYRDPSCDAYYLRHRWYLAEQQTFLSRDPADQIHRYGYTGGNPVGRTDPTGLRYTGGFSHRVDEVVHDLAPGVGGYIEPLLPVWGQVLGGIELVGLLPSFFHHPTTQGEITFGFLAASMASEFGALWKPLDRALADPLRASLGAFSVRQGLDVWLGGAQTFAQSYRHGHIEVPALVEGIDTTVAGIFWARMIGGVGYRPYGLSQRDVDDQADAFFANGAHRDRALVYRVRFQSYTGITTPWQESLRLGNYHELILAVSPKNMWYAQTNVIAGVHVWEVDWSRDVTDNLPSAFLNFRRQRTLIFEGNFDRGAVKNAFLGELPDQAAFRNEKAGVARRPMQDFNSYTNNCHQNAARVHASILALQRRADEE